MERLSSRDQEQTPVEIFAVEHQLYMQLDRGGNSGSHSGKPSHQDDIGPLAPHQGHTFGMSSLSLVLLSSHEHTDHLPGFMSWVFVSDCHYYLNISSPL